MRRILSELRGKDSYLPIRVLGRDDDEGGVMYVHAYYFSCRGEVSLRESFSFLDDGGL